jgi:ribonuclease HI
MMDRLTKQITILWVPGNMGIPRNEQADEEAKTTLYTNEEYPPKILKNG